MLLETSYKIILALLITGILGWIIGFFLGRIFGSANATELLKESDYKMRMREQEAQGLRAEATATASKISLMETELVKLTSTVKTREGWIREIEAKQQELQSDLDARISELDELKAEAEQEKADLKAQLGQLLTAAQLELAALKVRVAESEGAAKLTKIAEEEARVLRLNLAGKTEELKQASSRLQQLEVIAEQGKTRATELAQLKVRLTELEMMAREVKEPPVKVSSAATLPANSPDSDDLKEVFGIGPALEKLLNQQGIYWFRQIAEWTPEDVTRYDALLEQFRGRIERENWIASAREAYSKKYGDQL